MCVVVVGDRGGIDKTVRSKDRIEMLLERYGESISRLSWRKGGEGCGWLAVGETRRHYSRRRQEVGNSDPVSRPGVGSWECRSWKNSLAWAAVDTLYRQAQQDVEEDKKEKSGALC